MKAVDKSRWATMFFAMGAMGCANAAPQVTVNFFNNTGDNAAYVRGNNKNETTTYLNASPSPSEVAGGAFSTFVVRGTTSSPIVYATVRYQAGVKSCQFTTSYLMNTSRGGVRAPKWNRSAVAGGGAKCEAVVTSVNFSSHDWVVNFSMR
jgi:hypothetical protein